MALTVNYHLPDLELGLEESDRGVKMPGSSPCEVVEGRESRETRDKRQETERETERETQARLREREKASLLI